MTVRNLGHLLAPRSVALIGASATDGKLGTVAMQRLLAGGFEGAVHLVNPKYRELAGRPCAARVGDLETAPDLAVIVTPAPTIPEIVAELGAAGTRAAVVISAGLDAPGKQAMLDAARPHCLRILGPNCLGLQVPSIGLDASFSHMAPRRGGLALLSQSGAIVTAMVDWAEAREIGFSVVASMGEMADVDVGDLIDHLAGDTATRAILLYLEQVTDARKFISAARAASRVKPVIAIKAGRSRAAARAAASHTGALAGSDTVYEAALRRAGVLRVDELEDLFDAAAALARHRPPAGAKLAIVTNGGGAGVLAADGLARAGAELAEFGAETLARLDAVLPGTWSRANPVDIIGDAPPERYKAAVAAALDDPETDALLVMNCPTGLASSSDAAEAVVETVAARPNGRGGKPVLAAWLGEASTGAARRSFERAGVPVFPTPGKAVRAFGYLARVSALQRLLMRTPPAAEPGAAPDVAAARGIVAGVRAEGRRLLTEPEAKALLAAFGVPTVETLTAATPEAAAEAAERLLARQSRGAEARVGEAGIALKILSREISHKSDVGGVRLNLATAEEVGDAARAMLAHVAGLRPDAAVDGFAVQPMIRRPRAHELIAGLAVDRVFGPILLFGAGGTSVEVVADKAVALPPLDRVIAADMIEQTRIARLLAGYRDRPAADREAIAAVLLRLSEIAVALPEVAELDINPLIADEHGALALDARVALAENVRPPLAIRPWPAEWAGGETVRGRALEIRPVRPEDEPLYAAFFERLSPDDLRSRFFGAVGHPSHQQIARFTQIDYARAMAFVAIERETGALLGEARLAADPDGEAAEFAVIVRSDRKRQGIGGALMRRLIAYARAEEIGRLSGHVLDANAAMLGLAADLGFERADVVADRSLETVSLDLCA